MTASTPTLAQDLINIHKVINRALTMDINKGTEYLKYGFPSEDELLGYIKFNHCLTAVLCSHHQGEELIAFPALRKVLPDVPYAQFESEHQRISDLMALIPHVVNDLSSDEPKYGLRVLIIIIRKISKIWSDHAKLEEEYFSEEVISAKMNADLQEAINEAVNNYRLEHSRPLYWVVPFLLYNLEPEDRTSMGSYFPSMVFSDFIPNLWREESRSMRPFLLD